MPIEVLEMYLDHIADNRPIMCISMTVLLGVIYVHIVSIYGTKRFLGISTEKVMGRIERNL